jgi:hypothetical protein
LASPAGICIHGAQLWKTTCQHFVKSCASEFARKSLGVPKAESKKIDVIPNWAERPVRNLLSITHQSRCC